MGQQTDRYINILKIDLTTVIERIASGYCSTLRFCCRYTDKYEPSAAASSMASCPYHTKPSNNVCQGVRCCTILPSSKSVSPRERHPIKLTCLLPSKSCYTNNVTHSNRLTGLQPSLEPRICAKNKHEKDLREDYFSIYV